MLTRLTDAVMVAMRTGDETLLRSFPEGRQFLCGIARNERRNTPLWLRRAPRLMGKACAEGIDRIVLSVLRNKEDYRVDRSDH